MQKLRKKWKRQDKFINGLKAIGMIGIAVVDFIVGKRLLIFGPIIEPDINSENYDNEIHS